MLKSDPLSPRIFPCQHGFLKILAIFNGSRVDFALGFHVGMR